MNARLQARLYSTCAPRLKEGLAIAVGAIDGVCLGLLCEAALDAVDEQMYTQVGMYVERDYNERGLFTWEQDAVDRHFPAGGRVAVTGAGGGREVLALCRQGFDAVGYEPNPMFVEQGNLLLERAGVTGRIELSARTGWPAKGQFDAVLLGWGSYHHVRSSRRRIELLRQARQVLPPDGILMASFFVRNGYERYCSVVRRVGNGTRRLRGASTVDPIEMGDRLTPAFAHMFTRREVERELSAGGFDMVGFDTFEYGTAIGRARAPGTDTEREHTMADEADSKEIRVREGGAVWREIENETVLLDLESSVYIGINSVGSMLWKAMTQGTTRGTLIDLVVTTHGIDGDQAATHVDAFIAQCRERNLLAT